MLSRFTWLHPTKLTSSKEAIDFLKILFDIFGLPKEVISDRGTAFTSREFDAMVNTNNIIHRKVAVAAPMVLLSESIDPQIYFTKTHGRATRLEAFSQQSRVCNQ